METDGELTEIFLAAKHGRVREVESCLAAGASVEEAGGDRPSYTPLAVAAGFGHLEVLSLLLSGAAPRPSTRVINAALWAAAAGWHVECVQMLQDHARSGADDAKEMQLDECSSPRHSRTHCMESCILGGCERSPEDGVATLAALLDGGADPNALLSSGETVLLLAIGQLKVGMVRCLLQHKADSELPHRNSGETPRILAQTIQRESRACAQDDTEDLAKVQSIRKLLGSSIEAAHHNAAFASTARTVAVVGSATVVVATIVAALVWWTFRDKHWTSTRVVGRNTSSRDEAGTP